MTTRLATPLLAGLLAAAAPSVGHASPASVTPGAEPPAPWPPAGEAAGSPSVAPGRWYGWQLVLSDLVFLSVAADGLDPRPELPWGSAGAPIGLLGVVLAPPAIHYLHGNPRRAVIGALVRGVAVGLWSLVVLPDKGGSSCTAEDASCSGSNFDAGEVVLIGLTVGSAVGAFLYVVVDDLFLAREPVKPAPERSLSLAPIVSLRASGGVVGMAGRF